MPITPAISSTSIPPIAAALPSGISSSIDHTNPPFLALTPSNTATVPQLYNINMMTHPISLSFPFNITYLPSNTATDLNPWVYSSSNHYQATLPISHSFRTPCEPLQPSAIIKNLFAYHLNYSIAVINQKLTHLRQFQDQLNQFPAPDLQLTTQILQFLQQHNFASQSSQAVTGLPSLQELQQQLNIQVQELQEIQAQAQAQTQKLNELQLQLQQQEQQNSEKEATLKLEELQQEMIALQKQFKAVTNKDNLKFKKLKQKWIAQTAQLEAATKELTLLKQPSSCAAQVKPAIAEKSGNSRHKRHKIISSQPEETTTHSNTSQSDTSLYHKKNSAFTNQSTPTPVAIVVASNSSLNSITATEPSHVAPLKSTLQLKPAKTILTVFELLQSQNLAQSIQDLGASHNQKPCNSNKG